MPNTMPALLIDGKFVGYFPPTEANKIGFDNTGTDLESDDVQGAIEEVNEKVPFTFGVENSQYGYYDANGNFVDFKSQADIDSAVSSAKVGDAVGADVLAGKTFTNSTTSGVNGTMTNNGAVTGAITTKSQQITIPQGYHNGNGSVAIASAEQEKIVAENIKEGVEILGVIGTHSGGASLSELGFYPFPASMTFPNYGGSSTSNFTVPKELAEIAKKINLKGYIYVQNSTQSKSIVVTVSIACNDGTNVKTLKLTNGVYSLQNSTIGEFWRATVSSSKAAFKKTAVDLEIDMEAIREFVESEGYSLGNLDGQAGWGKYCVFMQMIASRNSSTTSATTYFGFTVNPSKSSASVTELPAYYAANPPQVKITF